MDYNLMSAYINNKSDKREVKVAQWLWHFPYKKTIIEGVCGIRP